MEEQKLPYLVRLKYRGVFVILVTNQINEGQQPCNTIAGSKIATEAIIYVAVMKGKNIIKKNLNL